MTRRPLNTPVACWPVGRGHFDTSNLMYLRNNNINSSKLFEVIKWYAHATYLPTCVDIRKNMIALSLYHNFLQVNKRYLHFLLDKIFIQSFFACKYSIVQVSQDNKIRFDQMQSHTDIIRRQVLYQKVGGEPGATLEPSACAAASPMCVQCVCYTSCLSVSN